MIFVHVQNEGKVKKGNENGVGYCYIVNNNFLGGWLRCVPVLNRPPPGEALLLHVKEQGIGGSC